MYIQEFQQAIQQSIKLRLNSVIFANKKTVVCPLLSYYPI